MMENFKKGDYNLSDNSDNEEEYEKKPIKKLIKLKNSLIMQRKGSYVYSDNEDKAADDDNISEEHKVDD